MSTGKARHQTGPSSARLGKVILLLLGLVVIFWAGLSAWEMNERISTEGRVNDQNRFLISQLTERLHQLEEWLGAQEQRINNFQAERELSDMYEYQSFLELENKIDNLDLGFKRVKKQNKVLETAVEDIKQKGDLSSDFHDKVKNLTDILGDLYNKNIFTDQTQKWREKFDKFWKGF